MAHGGWGDAGVRLASQRYSQPTYGPIDNPIRPSEVYCKLEAASLNHGDGFGWGERRAADGRPYYASRRIFLIWAIRPTNYAARRV